MSTLRILLAAAPDSNRADAWALFDDNGRKVETGRSKPASWPPADRREAVLAASCMRIIGLRLPPMPADRVAGAATFALEDQLAGPADEQHIAVAAQRVDGSVDAIVANRALVGRLAADFDRVLSESALAPRPTNTRWRWYASGAGGGFVRRTDGTAFATSEHAGVPPELVHAVEHAARTKALPGAVEIAWDADGATREDAAQKFGSLFVSGDVWRWDTAGSAAFASATDLRQRDFAPAIPAAAEGASRWLRMAAVVAAAALGLHIVATFGEWASLRIEGWRARSALATIAHDAGIGAVDDPAAAVAARYADARHRAGLNAPTDALPLLARAAPALAALPSGTLKAATYADGHWTFDLTKPDAGALDRLERQFTRSGLVTLQATNASGARLRVSLGAGAP